MPDHSTPYDKPQGDAAEQQEQLLDRLCVSGLSTGDWFDLADLMRDDRDAIKRYAETVHLCEFLSDHCSCNTDPDTYSQGAVSQNTVSADGDSLVPSSNVSSDNLPASRRRTPRLFGVAPILAALGLAASVALVFGTLLGLNINQKSSVVSEPIATASLPEQPLQPIGGAVNPHERLGRVTGLSPDASSDGLLRSLQVGEELRRGEVIQLAGGHMLVEFETGPTILVEGPAEFSLVGANAVFVRSGVLTVQNNGSFEIQTPTVAVECSDAEVSLAADSESFARVYVHDGSAHIFSSPRRNVQRLHLKSMAAGGGVQVDANGNVDAMELSEISEFDSIAQTWQDVMQTWHPYEQLVLADNPLAYWPLHRVRRNRRVLDLAQNGFDGQAIGNFPGEISEIASDQGRGAFFDGESYVEADRKPPIDLRTGFTIESWAKVAGGPEYQAIFTSRWVLDSLTPSQQCFGFTLYAGVNDHWEFWTGSGEYGINWQELTAPPLVERYRWTHVVATFTPQEIVEGENVTGIVRLFVDGVAVAEAEHRMSLVDFQWPARIGAAEFVPKSLTSWLFRGELRDIALYDSVLSAERIEVHFSEGKQAT